MNIDHLLRHRVGGAGNLSQVDFELGLRRFKAPQKFKPEKGWTNVTTNKITRKEETIGKILK
jgi:hypothetical protein